jgi:cytochrome c-type biogenesis protein CcmH/NrfF
VQATAAASDQDKVDTGADDAESYDTYLTSSEPVETKAAPVWVVPGILLVLVTMLALLGGVLGRGTRPALAPAKALNENASDDES